jgi:hypothetical protein
MDNRGANGVPSLAADSIRMHSGVRDVTGGWKFPVMAATYSSEPKSRVFIHA